MGLPLAPAPVVTSISESVVGWSHACRVVGFSYCKCFIIAEIVAKSLGASAVYPDINILNTTINDRLDKISHRNKQSRVEVCKVTLIHVHLSMSTISFNPPAIYPSLANGRRQ